MWLTIFFVGIFQYFWMYQKPSVLFGPFGPPSRDQHYHGTSLPCGGRDRLRESEIGVLEERELKVVVLADEHQCYCGIKTLGTNERINTTNNELGL